MDPRDYMALSPDMLRAYLAQIQQQNPPLSFGGMAPTNPDTFPTMSPEAAMLQRIVDAQRQREYLRTLLPDKFFPGLVDSIPSDKLYDLPYVGKMASKSKTSKTDRFLAAFEKILDKMFGGK